MTFEQAKNLKVGDILTHNYLKNKDGTPQRWKVNGKIKLFKKDPTRIEIPIKRRLFEFARLNQNNIDRWDIS